MDEVVAFIKESARDLIGFTPEVFPVSGKRALRAKENGDAPALAQSGFDRLEAFIAETLDEKERLRLKLLNPVGVAAKLVQAHLARTEERLGLLKEDFAAIEDIDAQLGLYREDLGRDFRFRLADVDNVLFDFEKRGNDFFEDTLRIGRIVDLVNQARVNSGVLPKLGALVPLGANTELFAGYAKNAATMTDATLEGGAATTMAAALRPQDMDTAKAFDLGLRHKGDGYALSVQGFSIRSKETVAADIAGTLQSENVDQGRRIDGIELSGNARVGAAWRLYGAFTYQKARYALGDVDAQGYPAKGFIRDGADLVGIAPRNLFLEATWRPGDAWRLGVNLRHVSSQAGYYANPRVANSGVDERMPAYTLLGASGSYQWDHLTLGLNLENITNKHYLSGVAPELMTSPSSIGRYFIGAPRTVVLWVRMEL